ncbi:MAG: magnesium/cobalt transporter CorA, partial [Deinococcales bacterium]
PSRARRDRVRRSSGAPPVRPGPARARSGRRLAPATGAVGSSPGSVIYTGPARDAPVTFEVIVYDEGRYAELRELSLEQALQHVRQDSGVRWLNVNGVHRTQIIEQIGAALDLHPLTMEDIVSLGQRPKIEDYERYLYIALRMLAYGPGHGEDGPSELDNEQLSVILLDGIVVTFQERPGDVFEPLRERLRQGKGRLRRLGADYLAYALLDIVIDRYFTVVEDYGDAIEDLEAEILSNPTTEILQRVNHLKRETLIVRKAVWPLREVIAGLEREEGDLMSPTAITYLRDAHDHAIQVIDTVESLRDMLTNLHDMYLSALSYRMNDVMKVLTIIATIFIPLSFLVGVYGMNFHHMPELAWPWAYPALWGLMLVIALGMLSAFKRRGWF